MIALKLNSQEQMLKDFHNKYGHLVSETPTLDIPIEVKRLRVSLIVEEVRETLMAMGFPVQIDIGDFDPSLENISVIADGIADSVYVLVGTDVSYGIPADRIFKEVHLSNMTKTVAPVEPGQKYGTKTPKGPDFAAPDIEGILHYPDQPTALEIKVALENA